MQTYLAVILGGGLGSALRFWISGLVARQWGESFPLGTLVVNVTGSFAIGLFATLTSPDGRFLVSPTARTLFMVGICGGYTTFSSFSLQTLNLIRDGQWFYASLNLLLSFVLCMLGVWLGHITAQAFNR